MTAVRMGIPNGIFFIGDPSARDFPDVDGVAGVWSTQEIVAVACLHEQEGEARITMGLAGEEVPGGSLIFDGIIKTPHRKIDVTTVPQHPTRLEAPILEQWVSSENTRVQIWASDAKFPDEVFIALH